MASFLFMAVILAPLLAPVVIALAAAGLARRAWRRLPFGGHAPAVRLPTPWSKAARLPSVATCALVATMAGAAAFGLYARFATSGFFLQDPLEPCTARGLPGDDVVERLTLPVSVRCVTGDGVGFELVPGWVNPMIFLGFALCALAVMTGILVGAQRRLSVR